MTNKAVHTDSAPAAVSTYSQAVKVNNTVYLSGQIPLDWTIRLVEGDIKVHIRRVFDNLKAVCETSAATQRYIKLNIFLTDLGNFAAVNEVMAEYFNQPFRPVIGVNQLPKGRRLKWMALL